MKIFSWTITTVFVCNDCECIGTINKIIFLVFFSSFPFCWCFISYPIELLNYNRPSLCWFNFVFEVNSLFLEKSRCQPQMKKSLIRRKIAKIIYYIVRSTSFEASFIFLCWWFAFQIYLHTSRMYLWKAIKQHKATIVHSCQFFAASWFHLRSADFIDFLSPFASLLFQSKAPWGCFRASVENVLESRTANSWAENSKN